MSKNPGNNRRQARLVNANSQFQGTLNQNNKIDFLKFRVSSQSRFNATLTGLRNNADLALFRGRKLLGQSKRPGKRNETIQALLAPGTYFVRVASRGGGRTRYRLQLATANPTPSLPIQPNLTPRPGVTPTPALRPTPIAPPTPVSRPTQGFYSYEFGYERLPRNPFELTRLTGIGTSVDSFLGDEPSFFVALLNQYGPEIANSVYNTALNNTTLRQAYE
ncbi:hypothetical protein C7B76_21300, partial [filamentous cyanobacterium CCP2]